MSNNVQWAIIDFDGTLLKGNSFNLLVSEVYRFRKFYDYFYFVYHALGRKVGKFSRVAFQESVIAYFKDWQTDKLYDWGQDFFYRVLEPRLFSEGIRFCKEKKNMGWKLLLATGALDFFAQPMAKVLGFDDVICTRLTYADNRFIGKIDGNVCLGMEKARRIKQFLSEKQISVNLVHGFSDHISDENWLRLIKFPNVVNPDRNFEKAAKKNGWPVIHWK